MFNVECLKFIEVMKKILLFVIIIAFALPMSAQNTQEWQSTSIMRGSGSSLSSQVTAVGATYVENTATTTDSYSPAQAPGSSPRKVGGLPGKPDIEEGDEGNQPLGDAVWPLLILACVYMVYSAARVYRRKRRA